MGCDIHMFAEKRSKYADESQEWQPMLAAIFPNRYYRKGEKIGDWNSQYKFQPYSERNYEVFSVLANVRNGYDIPPICEPRGLPVDIHEVTEWLLNEYDSYDHSPSWLTLEEVLSYDWDATESSYYPGRKLRTSADRFLANMAALKEYAETEHCDIRLVFGFDS